MVHDILILAASSGSSNIINFIGYIAIPIFLALVAGVWAVIKGGLRAVQFMARSEAAQRSIADSNVEIRDKVQETNDRLTATNERLTTFAEQTNERLNDHDQDLAVLKYAANSNGSPKTRRARVQRESEAQEIER